MTEDSARTAVQYYHIEVWDEKEEKDTCEHRVLLIIQVDVAVLETFYKRDGSRATQNKIFKDGGYSDKTCFICNIFILTKCAIFQK